MIRDMDDFSVFKEKVDAVMIPHIDNANLINAYLTQIDTGRRGSISAYSKLTALLAVIVANVPTNDVVIEELKRLLDDFTDSQILQLEAVRNVLLCVQKDVKSSYKITELVRECFVEGDEDASMEKDG